MTEEWRDRAACRDLPTDLFFPERHQQISPRAVAACARCPVSDECLTMALDEELRHGYFGGTSEKQRRALRRGRWHTDRCRICDRLFRWQRTSTGNTQPFVCSDECRREHIRRRDRKGPGRPARGFSYDLPHSPCDETDPRDRAAYWAVYPPSGLKVGE